MFHNNYAFEYKLAFNHLLQQHFRYVILPPAPLTELALSRMTAPLVHMFGPLINSRSWFRCIFLTFPLVWLHLVVFTFAFVKFGCLGFFPRHFTLCHLQHTIPTFLVDLHLPNRSSHFTTHMSPLFPLHSIQPLSARIIPACDFCISTDELLSSLRVLCAPQADKYFNYRP